MKWTRKRRDDIAGSFGHLETGKEFIDHVDELGILREHGQEIVETERTNNIPD